MEGVVPAMIAPTNIFSDYTRELSREPHRYDFQNRLPNVMETGPGSVWLLPP